MLKLLVDKKLHKSDVLIKIRLWVYVLALTHLIVVAVYLLSKDYSKSNDPDLQVYVKLKWKLMTAWFNLLTGPYLTMSIYCEWKDLKGKGKSEHVKLINKLRHFLFSSIILPVTTFGDIMFWRLYNKDRLLLMPPSADEFVSIWNHHSMHTVSLIFVLFDLVSVRRKRPTDMSRQILALTFFLTLYAGVCAECLMRGEYIYPGLKLYSRSKLLIIATYVYIANFFYYTGQWFVLDIIWSLRAKVIKIK